MPHRAYIGVGSNQGNKEENCRRAVREIGHMPRTRVAQVSSWFATEPWGAASTEWYVNGVAAVDTGLDPETLLKHCQAVEREMGRRPSPVRWGTGSLIWTSCSSMIWFWKDPGWSFRTRSFTVAGSCWLRFARSRRT